MTARRSATNLQPLPHDTRIDGRYSFLAQAIQLNVMLFMFNVFFPMLRVGILGGTAFVNAESEELVKAIAFELDQRFEDESLLYLTCGQQGIQEVFARNCGNGSQIRNLLVAGSVCQFRAGQDLIAARDTDAVKHLFLEVGDVYLAVEGGPGVAQDARRILARGGAVLPLKRTGGACAGKFDFPEKALSRPDWATEEQWQHVCRSTPPKDAAVAVASILEKLLEVKGRTSAAASTLEIDSVASDLISWADSASFASTRGRSWKCSAAVLAILLIVLIVAAGFCYYLMQQQQVTTTPGPKVLMIV
ncbi:unnamed protein product [Symbiodinium sp. CCMP2456]|nr:unnamed protein product [Symbiodinium sp. CCMP2456]